MAKTSKPKPKPKFDPYTPPPPVVQPKAKIVEVDQSAPRVEVVTTTKRPYRVLQSFRIGVAKWGFQRNTAFAAGGVIYIESTEDIDVWVKSGTIEQIKGPNAK